MRARQYQLLTIGLVLGTILFAVEFVSHAQIGGGAARNTAAPRPASAAENAEREQIWNSPNMLRARAWLTDYCKNSAKVTPEMAKHYQDELAKMTPSQLKLWLLRFDHAEEQLQQRQALWQQAHDASLKQALAANQATQRAYAAINQGENRSGRPGTAAAKCAGSRSGKHGGSEAARDSGALWRRRVSRLGWDSLPLSPLSVRVLISALLSISFGVACLRSVAA